MGVITAPFRGVLRDIVCNGIPKALHDHRPYAVCAFAGGWVLVAVSALGVPPLISLAAGAAAASLARGLALLTEARLPGWESGPG